VHDLLKKREVKKGLSTLLKPTLLPIDECEEWIWDILESTKALISPHRFRYHFHAVKLVYFLVGKPKLDLSRHFTLYQ
jgi:hypothetical protein